MNKILDSIWEALDKGHIVRRTCLGIAVYLTVDSYFAVKEYLATPDPDQWIVLAITGVPSAMLATMIKLYNDGRSNKQT